MAILSVLVALLAGSLDAMLWHEAHRRAERAEIQADIAAERAALDAEYEARKADREDVARAAHAGVESRSLSPHHACPYWNGRHGDRQDPSQ